METLMATTKPIANRKPRSAQPKVALTQVGTDVLKGDREQTHRQPNTVAYEEGLHRQPDRQPNGVAKNTKNIGLIEVYKMYELNKKNVVITESDMKWSALAVEVGIYESDLVAAIQSTDSLAEACKLVLEAKGL